MKKFLSLLLTFSAVAFTSAEAAQIKIGASSVPHAEILEFVKPQLEKQGVKLDIVIFQDYVLPNKSLESKDLDANFFQHNAYLKQQIKDYGYKFVSVAGVHIEPMGVYSKKYLNLDKVKEGSTIIISNSISDRTRVLLLLEKANLIALNSNANKSNLDIKDITPKSGKNLVFKADVDPSLLSRMYTENEADLVVINTNYALEAKINPLTEALVLEDANSPYVNVLVTREELASNQDILALAAALTSYETRQFIKEKYSGAVIPVAVNN